MKFDNSFLEEIKAIDPNTLAQIVGLKGVKPNGKGGLKALSPFAEEKTPSMIVNPLNGRTVWKDFSSGEGGNAIALVQKVLGQDFVTAVKTIAQAMGIQVVTIDDRPKQPKNQDKEKVFGWAQAKFQKSLSNTKTATRYLAGRGVFEKTIEKWGLGYAPDQWDYLTKGLKQDQLEKLVNNGLALRSEKGKTFDFLRGRITIPLRQNGKLLGFAGRLIVEAKGPKYINPSEKSGFDKSKFLFGLDEARTNGGSKVYVTEGYFDAIALDSIGVSAVATCGTATTESHLKKLFSSFDEVVFCFDGDKAGRKAAKSAAKLALPFLDADKTASFVILPEGKDPAELIQKGEISVFEEFTPLSEILTEGLEVADEKNQLLALNQLAKDLEAISNPLQRLFLMDRVAKKLGIDTQLLKGVLGM